MTSQNLKVLVLNQFALPREQGGGTRHIDLFGRLQQWTPIIMAGNRNHYSQEVYETSDSRFVLIPVPGQSGGKLQRLFGWISYTSSAFRRGMNLEIDLVYASSPHLLTPIAGVALSKIKRVPLVLEIRDLWPESMVSAGVIAQEGLVHRILSSLEGWLYNHADCIVGVTDGWRDYYSTRGLDDKFHVIPNGTELSDFEVAEERESLRSQYGFDGTTAIFAGAHGPKDGLDCILEAAAEAPEINFVLVGAGPAKEAAVQKAASLRLSNVRFMDPVPKEELPKLLKASDIGIHAVTPLPVFLQGMSPNKLFDYLAAGLPVASNARQALEKVAKPDEVGCFGESDDLAGCIKKIAAADDGQRTRWREASRQIIQDRFSRSRFAERLESLLNTISTPTTVITHVSTLHPPRDNRIFHKECRSLANAANFKVNLVIPQEGDSFENGITVHGIPRKRNRLIHSSTSQVAAWRRVKETRPDIVHIHDPELIPLGILWKVIHRSALVYDAHEDLRGQIEAKPYIPKWLRPAVDQVARTLMTTVERHADAIVAATPSVARTFTREDVTVIRNFPWRDTYTRASTAAADRQGVIYVGALTKSRMIDTMLGAAARVPECHLRLVGPADNYAQQAISRVADHKNVEYLGPVPPEAVPELLANAQVGLILLAPVENYMESLPTKLFEYMAAGIPFIASDFPYWRKLLDGHDCGVFVNTEDPDDVARKLEALLGDPKERQRLGENGRRAFEEHFSFDGDGRKLAELMGTLASSLRRSSLSKSDPDDFEP